MSNKELIEPFELLANSNFRLKPMGSGSNGVDPEYLIVHGMNNDARKYVIGPAKGLNEETNFVFFVDTSVYKNDFQKIFEFYNISSQPFNCIHFNLRNRAGEKIAEFELYQDSESFPSGLGFDKIKFEDYHKRISELEKTLKE